MRLFAKLLHEKTTYIFIILFLLILGITNSTAQFIDRSMSIGLVLYVGLIVFVKETSVFWIIKTNKKILIWPLIGVFLVSSWINSSELREYLSREPVSETYRTDMDDFLKTYYLMEKGNDYYSSFKTAVELNAFRSEVSANLWSWRLPTIFYIWKILPGQSGIAIYFLFLLVSSACLFLSYEIVAPMLGARFALLSPYLLFPYLHFASRDSTLLQTEWWGMFLFLCGVYFVVKQKLKQATVLFVLAVVIRELFVIPLTIALVVLLLKKNKHWWIFFIPIATFFISMLFHGQLVSQHVIFTQKFLAPRFSGNKDILFSAFSFGSWEYVFFKLRIFIIFYIVGLVGLMQMMQKEKNNVTFQILFSCFVFPLTFLFIGTSIYNDYWGILFMPFVLISVPFILHKYT